MSSESKKRKEKRARTRHGCGLKITTAKVKRLLYYNSSIRKKNKMVILSNPND